MCCLINTINCIILGFPSAVFCSLLHFLGALQVLQSIQNVYRGDAIHCNTLQLSAALWAIGHKSTTQAAPQSPPKSLPKRPPSHPKSHSKKSSKKPSYEHPKSHPKKIQKVLPKDAKNGPRKKDTPPKLW